MTPLAASSPRPLAGFGGLLRLDELFAATVRRHGERIAVIDGSESITYRELDRRAEQVAVSLRQLGVGPGDLVGLWVPRSSAVYVAMLGILRVGAGYVPCDADTPAPRVEAMLADCAAMAVVTTGELIATTSSLPQSRVLVQPFAGGAVVEVFGGAQHLVDDRWGRLAAIGDIAYVIYTSGSTGRPKGVPVTHANVWAFLEGEATVFNIVPEDRIYQGFSVSFDASIEELWLAWGNGAALVCASREMALSGSALPAVLEAVGVTVLSCVPTLLSMFDRDIASLRLLIVGGEACPPALVERWTQPGRRMVNTYGPTETTVVATFADLVPGEPVRIGVPLPGYCVLVADPEHHAVIDGVAGELLIGGPAVTSGYLGRPELTAERFVELSDYPGERWYCTGDLVAVDTFGQLEFLGRIDDQVKIRGYRIELGEIEAALGACEGVAGAAVAVQDNDGVEWIVGYVTLRADAASFDEAVIRHVLRSVLPPYMVPARIVALDRFPTLTSGKTDRARLPPPDSFSGDAETDRTSWTSRERAVASAWQRLLPGINVVLDSNFFDVGGHSLVATALVSSLRTDPTVSALSVRDVYTHPDLRAFAAHLDALAMEHEATFRLDDHRMAEGAGTATDDQGKQPVDRIRHALCGFAQLVSLYPLFALMMPPYVIAFFAYDALVVRDSRHQVTVLALLAVFVVLASMPVRMALAVITKWIVLGRLKPGRYRLWGFTYWRVWFVTRAIDMLGFGQLRGSPMATTIARLLGARIGNGVYLATVQIGLFDMIDIGDGASIGHNASLQGFHLADGWLHVGPITIGTGARVGNRALLAIGTSIGDHAELGDGAMLPQGGKVPEGESWAGSPAQPVAPSGNWPDQEAPLQMSKAARRVGYFFGFAALTVIPTLAAVPEALLLGEVDARYCDFTHGYGDIWKLAVVAPFAVAGFVILLSLLIAGAKRLAIGRLEPGLHSLDSTWAIRKWFHDALLTLSLDALFPMYASVYLSPWLRLMGATVGRNVEVSTAENMNPDLVTFDDGVFVADAVCLGPESVHHGWVRLERVHIGRHSFVGNSAIVPGGTTLGADSLIGVMSMPPVDPDDAASHDESWLGNPSFRLPSRQQSTDFGSERTFSPPLRRRALRALIEFWRIVLPGSLISMGALVVFLAASDLLHDSVGATGVLVLFPLLLAALGATLSCIVVVAKWILVGRYRAQERPLWDHFVWRSELVNALHENVAMSQFVQLLVGTPMLAWYFRALGAKIGKRCCLDSSYLTEFDLVEIGDEATINTNADLQTHLFEDRVMKMSTVTIGAGASVGTASVILYDAHVGNHARVSGQSLVMKGETIPNGSVWHGVPAVPASV